MKITPDTNVLLRAAVNDDEQQSCTAKASLTAARLIAIPSATLCEFVWVLRHAYKRPAKEIADAIRDLLDDERVETNRPAVDAGLTMLIQGGDFADGAIAYEGSLSGGDTFVTFDKKAAKLLSDSGSAVELLPSG